MKIIKKSQSYIVDLFLHEKDENDPTSVLSGQVDEIAAKALYNVWKNNRNKISKCIYRQPSVVSDVQVDRMVKAGFVKVIGNNLEITTKGTHVIRVMILGNDKCSFDKNADDVEFHAAKSNIKAREVPVKKPESDWWGQFLGE